MKKRTRLVWGVAIVMILLLLALFGGWFWSLGEARASTPPAIRIETVTAPVEWQRAGETTWTTLADSVDVQAGDSVRTGNGGAARIVWGDRGTTRLDANSQVTLSQVPNDGSLDPGAHIKLELVGGRIWSRLIKLLDLGSSVQVDSGSVVATVRGTAFGAAAQADGAQFAVTQSVVDVAGATGTHTLLRDNQWGDFSSTGTPRTVRDLQPMDTWATQNRAEDAKEDQDELSMWRERLQAMADQVKNAPGFLLDASESLHLSLASGKTKEDLAAAYAERRLSLLATDTRPQDAERFRAYAALAGANRGRLLGEWHGLATLREHTGQGDASDARSWRTSLAPESAADKAYLEAVAIDDRIDDVLASNQRDPQVIAGIRTDIDTFDGRVDGLDATPDEKTGLHHKAEALRLRIAGVDQEPVIQPPVIPAPTNVPPPGTQIPDPAQKPPVILKPESTSTGPNPIQIPVPTTVVYGRYQLTASPSSVSVGQAVALNMFGITSAGQADDLTSRTSFSVLPQFGTVAGNIFLPSSAGSVTVYGTVDGNTASASVTVGKPTAPVSTGLQSIALQFTGPTIMGCSAYNSYKVIAIYGTGKTADVTMLSKVSVTDPALIYVNSDGTLMSFCTVDVAQADVLASYTENQVTKNTSQTITVARDPASVSKNTRYFYP
jgi:hypothetical protein